MKGHNSMLGCAIGVLANEPVMQRWPVVVAAERARVCLPLLLLELVIWHKQHRLGRAGCVVVGAVASTGINEDLSRISALGHFLRAQKEGCGKLAMLVLEPIDMAPLKTSKEFSSVRKLPDRNRNL
jgi:hypothetical protein